MASDESTNHNNIDYVYKNNDDYINTNGDMLASFQFRTSHNLLTVLSNVAHETG